MQPMKRRVVRGPPLNLLARSLGYRGTNPASDYHAGPSNGNVEVGKSVLLYGARGCGVLGFTASSGVLEPQQRRWVPWSRVEKRSGSVGITCANPGARRFNRERDMIYSFCVKCIDLSTERRALEAGFTEEVRRSGASPDHILTVGLRGGCKPSVVGSGLRGTVRGYDTEIRGENHHVDLEKVVGSEFRGTGRGPHTKFNGENYPVDEEVFLGSGFRGTVRSLCKEIIGKNQVVDERRFTGLGFMAIRGLHTEMKMENHLLDEKLSEKVATVRKVRSTVRTKPVSTTSRRRRMFGRLVPTTTIPRRGQVDVELPDSVSITERKMELKSPTQREGEVMRTGGQALAQRVDQDSQEEKQKKGSGQIVRTFLAPESRNVFQHVTVTEDDEMSRRASDQAMALLRAALDEADEDTEDGKVKEEFQRSLRVGIVGAPNAGKSLLTNQLVGTRVSAVSRKTNTTHREHLGVYTKGDTQLLYYDTPGLHLDIEGSPLRVDAQHRVRNAWEIVDFCEALVVLVDAERQIRRPDKRVQRLVEKLGKQDENVSQKRVLCLNKVDIIEQKRTLLPLAKQFEDLLGFDRIFMISGLTGSGVKDVKDYLVSQAALRPWDEDPELKDHRDVALEVVREQVFEHLHEELPHTTKQRLVSWKVLKDGSIRIQQLLLVAKKEHQKILVGKNGAVIGDIGIKARKELTEVLGATVHLVLDVKLMTPSMAADE